MTPGLDCRCEPCQALRAEYGSDAALLGLYAKKLLKRGWAGSATDAEKNYQRAHAPWFASYAAQGRARNAPATSGNLLPEAEIRDGAPIIITASEAA